MGDLDALLAENRAAVDALLAAAEKSGAAFTKPRAPGKWSPSQIIEHVARSLEESAHVVSRETSKFYNIPKFMRPPLRALFYNRVLRNRAFPQAKTPRPMDPIEGQPTIAAARFRLHTALDKFDRQCRAQSSISDRITSTIFGEISLRDYVDF